MTDKLDNLSPEQIQSYCEQMMNESISLERLVNDLLDLAKLQSAGFTIVKEEISLNDVISDAVRGSRQIAKAHDITVKVTGMNKNFVFYGDYDRLKQMLMIILDNAIKFSHEGGTVTIKLSGKTLTIRDKGIGISEDDMPHIFEKFFKGTSERNKSGTGLGLAIAKQIAERHEIVLSVDSHVRNGTTFKFKL
jgi:signal transduction histidine kinase